jgi:hypothetical protein
MKSLADGLALAIVYIATREPRSDDDEEDDDVSALESIAAELQNASAAEISALRESSQRLAQTESDPSRREHYENLLSHLGIDP